MIQLSNRELVLNNTTKAENLSDKYSLINTQGLINIAENSGFKLHSVKVPRSDSPQSMHIVRLDVPGYELTSAKAERPQLIIQNAHNGTSSLRIMVGIFRIVCSNGLIAGDATLNVRLRHVGLVQQNVEDALQVAAKKTLDLLPQVDRLKGTILGDDATILNFAENALIIKAKIHGLSESETNSLLTYQDGLNVKHIIKPIRQADQENSLWNVFNRAQEKLVKFSRLTYIDDKTGKFSSLRATNGIISNTKLNQQLWELAEKTVA